MPAVVNPTRLAFRGQLRKNIRAYMARSLSIRTYNANHLDLTPPVLDPAHALQMQNLELYLDAQLQVRIPNA